MNIFTRTTVAALAMGLATLSASALTQSVYPKVGEVSMNDLGDPLGMISLSFENQMAEDLSVNPVEVKILNAEGVTITTPEGVDAINLELVAVNLNSRWGMASLNINLDPAIEYNGEYTLTIPAGTYQYIDNGVATTNEAATYTWTIIDGKTAGDGPKEFHDVVLTSISPDPLMGAIDGFLAGQLVTVTLEYPEEVGYMMGKIVCTNNGDILHSMFGFVKQEDNSFVWDAPDNFYFDENKTYDLILECFESYNPNPSLMNKLGELHNLYTGSHPVAFTESTVRIMSIDPKPKSQIKSNTITMTFNAPVEFYRGYTTEGGYGAQGTLDANPITDDKTAWVIKLDKLFTPTTTVEIEFKDADGAFVVLNSKGKNVVTQWDSELNASAYIEMEYNYAGGGVDVDVVPAPGTEVDRLYEFVFTNPNESSINIIHWYTTDSPNMIEVLDANGVRVAMGYKVEEHTDEGESWVKVTLNQEVVDNGTYTVVVPWTFFTLGEEFTSDTYKGGEYVYTITGNNTVYDLEPVSVTPEEGVVKMIDKIVLEFDEPMAINETANMPVVVDRIGNIYPATISIVGGGKLIVFTFEEQLILEEGVYMLSVGAGTFGTQAWVESGRKEGHAVTDLFYVWSIEEETGIEGVEAASADVKYVDMLGRKVANPAPGTMVIRISGDKTEKVIIK